MMATLSPSTSFKCFLCSCVFSLSLLLSLGKNLAMEGSSPGETHQIDHFHTVELSSLLPSDSCSPSTKDLAKQSTLKVVHKHGPCSYLNQDKSTAPTPTEVLHHDQSRVKSIHKAISNTRSTSISTKNDVPLTHAATLPAQSGLSLGTGNYIVHMGLGTPARQLSLIFDTGSDLMWTQCQPCAKSCYQQKDAIFDPTHSSSYHNVSCSSPFCSNLVSATGNTPSCTSSTCVYGIQYGDSSYSVGFFGTEKLTVAQADVFPNFYFGCGENNKGLFGGAAGLIGLGRNKLSLVSQTASKYNKLFSYCLPSSSSGTGYLTFGSGSKAAKFTPFSSSSAVPSNFYGLDFTGLSVGGKKLAIPQSAFTTAGAIIDSGTVITRLPPAAYSALRAAFRQGMSKYPSAPALSILDTCYDLSAYTSVMIPTITASFNGGVNVNIDAKGILYVNSSPSQACLAFASNSDASDVAIFGNAQQKTLEVVYDVAKMRVGFASGGCS